MSILSSTAERTKISVLADELTVNGFKLTGVNGSEWSNPSTYGEFSYLSSVYEDTPEEDILSIYHILIQRKEIAILFVGGRALEVLKEYIPEKKEMFPLIMELPTKETSPSESEEILLKRLRELSGASRHNNANR
ncbi:V-type H+-transporting ATPase subunit F [Nematocida sp. LUAm3]|nr:V-type H+-transporting ATPase subunit F [Nematocida sp. LUAm3]KAI5173886.1 V-type H+-transporting ATPase subunit F [Nematocida sp. LUAm2]KAI5177369.1 V-type H+-transporting ATPase subunit F [Nematocida sp. LUAm1]